MRQKLAFLLAALLCLSCCAPALAVQGQFTHALAAVKLPSGARLREVRSDLESWCSRADQALAATGQQPDVTCSLETEADAWTLLRFWAGEYCLATVRLDAASGQLRLPGQQTLEALGDATFLQAVLALQRLGITIEPEWYAQRATRALLLDWLTRAYEHLAGSISLEGTVLSGDLPAPLGKAAVIGLVPLDELADQHATLSRRELTAFLLDWATLAEQAYCRRAAQPATLHQAKAALQLAADLAGLPLNAERDWIRTDGDQTAIPLTRVLYARAAVSLFEVLEKQAKATEPRWMPVLDDSENKSARAACGLGLMSYVLLDPDGFLCFDPDRVMSMLAVRQHARRFAMAGLSLHEEAGERSLAIGQAAPLLNRLLGEFAAREVFAGQTVTVDNGIAQPWYLSQDGSGLYSDTNCMPAAAAMVLRWLDPQSQATPESLREQYPQDGAPWYAEQVMTVFRQNGVRYELPDVNIDEMVAALDAGRILLVLLNETGSGHCVVVKGYQREGAGLWFVVYDPSSPTTDVYGQPIGLDRRIEATELVFAMECHWWLYFDISRDPGPKVPVD